MGRAGTGHLLARPLLVALLAAGALWADPGAAQERSPGAAHGVLDVPVRFTRLHDERSTMAGAAALLGIGERFAFGGAGWFLVGDSPIRIGSGPNALDLTVGYGGLLGEVSLARSDRGSLALRLLVGAGNATISLSAVDTEIASDNFGVLEPELSASWLLTGMLHARLGVGYRDAFGLEDLPEVASDDFDAFSVSLGFSLRQPY